MQEATASLATAKETSVDAAVVPLFLNWVNEENKEQR